MFAIKAYLKLYPFKVLSLSLVFSTFMIGIPLRIFERTSDPEDNEYEYLWNAFWVIILTMTTVGYGDIYPVTHLGRGSAIVACIWGMFIVSLFIVALTI